MKRISCARKGASRLRVSSRLPEKEKPLKRCFSQEASEIRGGCEVSSRRRLMFLLFCLLFRCHEGSSVNDFPLQRFSTTGPCTLKNQPYLLYGMVLYPKILRQYDQSVNTILQFCPDFFCCGSPVVAASSSAKAYIWLPTGSDSLTSDDEGPTTGSTLRPMRRDPVELEIFKNLYHSIAEEMGAALRRTAFSPNIKERRDYSCAVFDGAGEVIAMGDHMPVHLGSMPMSVRAAIDAVAMKQGDMVMLNDPFRGGTHLPDITLVAPVFVGKREVGKRGRGRPRPTPPDFYVASRAHHADVGGAYPGSMGLCREIYQEGVRIPPVKLMRAGAMDADVLAMLLNNVRTPEEREGDLGAQIAACHTGAERLKEVCSRYGVERARRAAGDLLDYSEELMRAFLRKVHAGEFQAEDFLDGDGISDRPVKIAVKVTVHQPEAKRRQDAVAPGGGARATWSRWTSPAAIRRLRAALTRLRPLLTRLVFMFSGVY